MWSGRQHPPEERAELGLRVLPLYQGRFPRPAKLADAPFCVLLKGLIRLRSGAWSFCLQGFCRSACSSRRFVLLRALRAGLCHMHALCL
jgi:hypothetical protein